MSGPAHVHRDEKKIETGTGELEKVKVGQGIRRFEVICLLVFGIFSEPRSLLTLFQILTKAMRCGVSTGRGLT